MIRSKIIAVLIALSALPVFAQSIRVEGKTGNPTPIPVDDANSAVTTVTFTSGTSADVANTVTVTGFANVMVSVHYSSTVTGGQGFFEASDDNTNWYGVTMGPVDGNGSAPPADNYTFSSAAGNIAWRMFVGGFTYFRVRVHTPVVGAGSAIVNITLSAHPAEPTAEIVGTVTSQGSAADGAAITGNPHQMGAKVIADGTNPTALTPGNVGYPAMTPDRRIYVDTTHSNFFSCNASAMTANTQCTTGLSGVGLSYYIDSVMFSTGLATNLSVVSSTTNGTACASSPVTVIPVTYFQNATGGGGAIPIGSPIKVTANSALCCTVSAANASSCLITGHIAP